MPPKSSPAFKKAYANLNPEQKQAVDTIDGPVMVVAGPGTGKTQILTLRIANILLRTDTPPDGILALTFTESAAATMRRRLVSLIGSPAYSVTIGTFHSFCSQIISRYPEYFKELLGSRPIDQVKQIDVLRSLISARPLKALKPTNHRFFYIHPLLKLIRDLKHENISPTDLKKINATENKIKIKNPTGPAGRKETTRRLHNREAALLYADYQKHLRQHHFHDYDDMILETVKALTEHSELLAELQEQYQYFLVDEHQDTNGAQNKVLELLGRWHNSPNIFLVGDSRQAIYRFQGASLANFNNFKHLYPKTKIISLKNNYRSVPVVLNAAADLWPDTTPLKSARSNQKGSVTVAPSPDTDTELNSLLTALKKILRTETVSAGDIAVLYRRNRDAFPISDCLTKAGLPHSILSDLNILEDSHLKKLLTLLKALSDPTDDTLLIPALHLPFLELSLLDVFKLTKAISLLPRSAAESRNLMLLMQDEQTLATLNLAEPDKIKTLGHQLLLWQRSSYQKYFLSWFEDIVRASGFLKFILQEPNYPEHIGRLSTLFAELKKLTALNPDYSLTDFILYLKTMSEHNLLLKNNSSPQPDAIQLMTAHKAKGREFTHVFVLGATEQVWTGSRHRSYFNFISLPALDVRDQAEEIEDERRLFYVALTRAKQTACLSYSHLDSDGRELTPLRFVSAIKAVHKQILPEPKPHIPFLTKDKPADKNKVSDRDWLLSGFIERGLSVTALNNYLKCPWRFFYENLLRLPHAKNPALSFGTSVHAALNDIFTFKNDHRPVDSKLLLERFEHHLEQAYLPASDLTALLKKGRQVLPGYYKANHKHWPDHSLLELSLTAHLPAGSGNSQNIILTGKLDRLNLPANLSNGLTVTDYKTGRPKSRNDIEGKTKHSQGDYKRQLVFYRLLGQLHQPKAYDIKEGILDFVEPTPAGKYKQEVFALTNDDTAKLAELITKTWQDITTFSFWDKTCSDPDCDYCALRHSLKK